MFRGCLSMLILAAFATVASAWPATESSTQQRLSKLVAASYRDRPLNEVLNDLGRQAGVNFYCRPESLHAEGVARNTPITLELSTSVSLRTALYLVLDQLRLNFTVKPDGVIWIGSEIDQKVVEKTYDISGLAKRRGEREIASLTFKGQRSLADGVIDLLTSTVHPETWDASDRGISKVENDPYLLVIRQSEGMHQSVSDLLDQLHRLRELRVMTTIAEASINQADLEAFVFEQKLSLPIVKLTTEQADAFRKLKSLDAKPRHYTSFNGETITTPKFELQAVVASNRSGVGLKWTQLHSTESDVHHEDQLTSGAMLLIDVTDDASAKANIRKYFWISPQVLHSTSDRGDIFERAPTVDDN